MKRWIERILVGVILLVLGYVAGNRTETVLAQSQTSISVPKSYGRCIGAMAAGLIFEDSSGTIRIVTAQHGRLEATITRN
ncbi:MAG TPA: hypothetical protein VGZ48_07315 [Candidatus Acidoferrales bacterium]|jgi:hypothetical protein|nr:hypothetical protein [Candidatus Acidoferrales bacterium]